MRAEKKEINIQIGKRLQIARENGGHTQETFDLEAFLANCSREERDEFIGQALSYMKKLMTGAGIRLFSSVYFSYVYGGGVNEDSGL